LLFLLLAHILTRLIQFGCLETGVVMGYARSADRLFEDIVTLQPTFLLAVPRVLDKVVGTARRQASGAKRHDFDLADETAQEWSRQDDPRITTRAKRVLADALIYRGVREGLGGRVRHCVSGGAPLSPQLARFLDAAGITVLERYGLTETTGAAALNTPEPKPPTCSSSSSPAATNALVIITSNKPFGRWGEVLGDPVAAAMIDRLVHHAEVITTKGDSYRLKDRDPGRVPTDDPQ
jgi:long-subunit acyl-CoA synthetase (AMP-forming)